MNNNTCMTDKVVKTKSFSFMKRIKFEYLCSILFLAILWPGSAFSQEVDFGIQMEAISKMPDDTLKVISLIDLSKTFVSSEPKAMLDIYAEAIKISEKIRFDRGSANSHLGAGLAYYFLGEYPKALEEWKSSEIYFIRISDDSGLANVLSNAGAVYYNMSKLDEALELYLRSLKIAEEIGDAKRLGSLYQNIAALHQERGDLDQALDMYLQALRIFKEYQVYKEGIGLAALNAGKLYDKQNLDSKANEMFLTASSNLNSTPYYTNVLSELGNNLVKIGNLSQGLELLDSAYNVAARAENPLEMAIVLFSIASAHEKGGNTLLAITYYENAKYTALKVDSLNPYLENIAHKLVRLYSSKNDFASAFENQQLLQRIKDNKQDIESERKFNTMLFSFEIEKKEVEIAEQQAIVKAKRIQQYGLAGGFFLMAILALVFFTQRKRISKEKARSEELLLNILPYEVAEELKDKGSAEARLIDQVTVLFTDFKGFTTMSELLSPKDLVKDLHESFSLFDNICEKYGIEKIKTIGDAYMAVGGLPSPNNTHANDVAQAAIEMAEVIRQGKEKKIDQKLPFFEVRIGIHTGPVVAGIVGVKKFQYDIWGDTVNTASRMESSGEVGKVNISEATHALVKDNFECEFRGEIAAKGKGKLGMYFISLKK